MDELNASSVSHSSRWLYVWPGVLVTLILTCIGLFLWGVLAIPPSYTGHLAIMRGHELCEMHMVQAMLNFLTWLGAFFALILLVTVGLMRASLSWRAIRILMLLAVAGIAMALFIGSDDWLTSSISGLVIQQGHQLDAEIMNHDGLAH